MAKSERELEAEERALAREDKAIRKWLAEVSTLARSFEGRWSMMALKRVDPDLARLFLDERDDFEAALVTGTRKQIEGHGAALCRGYRAIIRRMEEAAEPDNAYLLGQDIVSGFKVAIGPCPASVERVENGVVFVTPDEVATILAGLEKFRGLALIKQFFPGAEITRLDRFPDEPAKAESGIAA